MSIQYSTRRISPIPFIQPINVHNIPMYESDFGLALLAWASPSQQEAIISAIDRHQAPLLPCGEPDLEEILLGIRERGYAVRSRRYRFAKANTIAIGVVLDHQCIAAFNLLFKRSFREEKMASLFLPHMLETSERIASRIRFDGIRIVPK